METAAVIQRWRQTDSDRQIWGATGKAMAMGYLVVLGDEPGLEGGEE